MMQDDTQQISIFIFMQLFMSSHFLNSTGAVLKLLAGCKPLYSVTFDYLKTSCGVLTKDLKTGTPSRYGNTKQRHAGFTIEH